MLVITVPLERHFLFSVLSVLICQTRVKAVLEIAYHVLPGAFVMEVHPIKLLVYATRVIFVWKEHLKQHLPMRIQQTLVWHVMVFVAFVKGVEGSKE